MTHSALVEIAAKWLQKKRCSVIVTEVATASCEHPDAIGWYGPNSILIECKASRADFMADKDKAFRQAPEIGIGRLRYFLSLPGVISVSDLPENWGLLELTGDRIAVMREPERFSEINERHEISILLSIVKRIGQTAPTGVSIKCYSIETKNRATLGIAEDISISRNTKSRIGKPLTGRSRVRKSWRQPAAQSDASCNGIRGNT